MSTHTSTLTHRVARGLIAATLATMGAADLAAQADLPARGAPLLQRVTGVRDGTVRLTFAVRPDVCGSGNSIRTGPNRRTTWGDDRRSTRDVEWDDECESGPMRVALDVRGGQVQALRYYVGGRWRAAGSDVTDFGTVPAAQGAGMLLALAERGGSTGSMKVARDAIFPATLADSATTWPVLLRLAREERLSSDLRSQAVFWLGNAAGDAATRGLTELVDDPEREVRDQAVFALSRRDRDEGVPALIRIARTHRDPQTRRTALFWLGRSKDPRALALFEELLTGK
jgi:hypothetical protein